MRTRAGYLAPSRRRASGGARVHGYRRLARRRGLHREDLDVVEDGVEQKIDAFQEAVDPVSIVLALDSSGSMKKQRRGGASQAARDFVVAVRPEDSLAPIMFADQADVRSRPGHGSAVDVSTRSTIYVPIGGTALYDALWNSLA